MCGTVPNTITIPVMSRRTISGETVREIVILVRIGEILTGTSSTKKKDSRRGKRKTMDSPVLDSLCLAHYPRWITVGYVYGWYSLVCSNCGEPKTCRLKDVPAYCPNCEADMRINETDFDYQRAIEQLEHDILYEPTFNPDDGSM